MVMVRFSTESVPAPARKEAVEATISSVSAMGLDFMRDRPPLVDIGFRSLPGAGLMSGRISAFKCTIAPEDGACVLLMGQSGVHVIEHADGHRVEIGPGQAAVAPVGRVWTSTADKDMSFISVVMPASVVERAGFIASKSRECLPQSPSLRLLQSYANTMLAEDEDPGDAEAGRFSAHMQDLALLAFSGTDGQVLDPQAGRSVRAVRLNAVKADIAAHFDSPGLTLDWLARRHGISRRYLRALFYGENTSFTDYVLKVRLDHAHDRLSAGGPEANSIAAIALESGFGDLSWFNQAFRRRFGMTPADVRARAR